MELAPVLERLAKQGGDSEAKDLETMWLVLGDIDRAWQVGKHNAHGERGLTYLTDAGRCDEAADYATRGLKQLGAIAFGRRTRDFSLYTHRWELLHFLDGCLKRLDKRMVAGLVAAVPKVEDLMSSWSVDWTVRLLLAVGHAKAAKALLKRYLQAFVGHENTDAWLATAIELSLAMGDRDGAKKLLSKAAKEWTKRKGLKGFEAPSVDYLFCKNCGSTVMAQLAGLASQLGLRDASAMWKTAVRAAGRFKDPEARLIALGSVARLAVEAGEGKRARTLLTKHMPGAAAAFNRQPLEKGRVYDDPASDFVMAAAALGDRKLALKAWRATPRLVPTTLANTALARLLASKPSHRAVAKVVGKGDAESLFAASLVMTRATPDTSGCERLARLWRMYPLLQTGSVADLQRRALWGLLDACPKIFDTLATEFRTQKKTGDLEHSPPFIWALGAAMTGMRGDFEAAFALLTKVPHARQRYYALLVMLNPGLTKPLSARAKVTLARVEAMKN